MTTTVTAQHGRCSRCGLARPDLGGRRTCARCRRRVAAYVVRRRELLRSMLLCLYCKRRILGPEGRARRWPTYCPGCRKKNAMRSRRSRVARPEPEETRRP